jgi:hypothetical protein
MRKTSLLTLSLKKLIPTLRIIGMNVKELKDLLFWIPDDYSVGIEDINFNGMYRSVDKQDFIIDRTRKEFLTPGSAQNYVD